MKYLKIIFLILILQGFNNFVFAETKIAFIDMQFIMDKSLAGQSLKKQLENLHKKNLENFKKKEDSLKKKEQEVLAKKNILSDEDLKNKFSDMEKELTVLGRANEWLMNTVKKGGSAIVPDEYIPALKKAGVKVGEGGKMTVAALKKAPDLVFELL